MNGSHLAGAGVGALIGATLVALGSRIGLELTNVDSATLGMAAVAVFVGVGHAVGEYGLSGLAGIAWHGREKPLTPAEQWKSIGPAATPPAATQPPVSS